MVSGDILIDCAAPSVCAHRVQTFNVLSVAQSSTMPEASACKVPNFHICTIAGKIDLPRLTCVVKCDADRFLTVKESLIEAWQVSIDIDGIGNVEALDGMPRAHT